MTVISGQWDKDEVLFPCAYISGGDALASDRFSPLRAGFRQLLEEYEPAKQFVLTVEHHSADLLSTYLMRTDPGPKEAFESSADEG